MYETPKCIVYNIYHTILRSVKREEREMLHKTRIRNEKETKTKEPKRKKPKGKKPKEARKMELQDMVEGFAYGGKNKTLEKLDNLCDFTIRSVDPGIKRVYTSVDLFF